MQIFKKAGELPVLSSPQQKIHSTARAEKAPGVDATRAAWSSVAVHVPRRRAPAATPPECWLRGALSSRRSGKRRQKKNVFKQTQLVPQWSRFKGNSKRGRGRRKRIPDSRTETEGGAEGWASSEYVGRAKRPLTSQNNTT